MTLPEDFVFSQNSLQDYVACPRLFDLRHLKRLPWPAIQSEPVIENERRMELGDRFHQLVCQHNLGLSLDQLNRQAGDQQLRDWWQSYLSFFPQDLPPRRRPEFVLSICLDGYRVAARYDLLAIEPGASAVIVDWKTGRRKPRRDALEQRIQTRLYPLLLVEGGTYLNGGQPLEPEQVEMIYWFTALPNQPERFCYRADQYARDRVKILDLIHAIENTPEDQFAPTNDERTCGFCRYRSRCERGIEAALDSGEEMDIEPGFGLSADFFSTIEEVAF